MPLSIEPPYFGNTHGPVNKVRNSHGAELKQPALVNPLRLLFVNEDEAIAHDAVTFRFSLIRIWTAPHRAAEVAPADLVLLRVEVDERCDAASSAVLGSYRRRTTSQHLSKLVLHEDPGTQIIDPVRPTVPGGAGKLRDDGKIEISVEVDISRMESGAKRNWLIRGDR